MLKIEWDGQHFTVRCSDPGSGRRGWKKTGLSPYGLLDEIRRLHPSLFNTENEFDIHVWRVPESEEMEALYTISKGPRGIAIQMPLGPAMSALQGDLLDDEEQQREHREALVPPEAKRKAASGRPGRRGDR